MSSPRARPLKRRGTTVSYRVSFGIAFGAATCGLLWLDGPAHAAAPTTADCLAASDASLRLESDHQLRAERAQLLVCAAASCPADIRKECVGRVEEVNAAIPSIIFEAKDADGSDVSDVKVTMDGEELARRLEGMALSIDPGSHSFTFEAPGQATVRKQFVIREGQKDRREPVTFPAASSLSAATPRGSPPAPSPAPASTAGEGGLGGQAVAGIVIVGVGVVGLGAGTVLGLLARSKRDDAQKVCPGQCADQSGVNMWADARTTGNLSTGTFIAAGAVVALGSVLWLTGAHGSSARTTARADANMAVGVGLGSVDVRGRW